MSTDPEKIRDIIDWPEPKNIHEVCSFHGLATFYRQFIHGFSSIVVLVTNCIKKGEIPMDEGCRQSVIRDEFKGDSCSGHVPS